MSTTEPFLASECTDRCRSLDDSGNGNDVRQGTVRHGQMVRREMVAGLLFPVTLFAGVLFGIRDPFLDLNPTQGQEPETCVISR